MNLMAMACCRMVKFWHTINRNKMTISVVGKSTPTHQLWCMVKLTANSLRQLVPLQNTVITYADNHVIISRHRKMKYQ